MWYIIQCVAYEFLNNPVLAVGSGKLLKCNFFSNKKEVFLQLNQSLSRWISLIKYKIRQQNIHRFKYNSHNINMKDKSYF